jgi:hypothetical protein
MWWNSRYEKASSFADIANASAVYGASWINNNIIIFITYYYNTIHNVK